MLAIQTSCEQRTIGTYGQLKSCGAVAQTVVIFTFQVMKAGIMRERKCLSLMPRQKRWDSKIQEMVNHLKE